MNNLISRLRNLVAEMPATPGPALKYFRSISVLGKLDAPLSGDTYANHLGRWFERFEAFERRHFGFDQGRNQSLATGRSIMFTGNAVLSSVEAQMSLCNSAKQKGFMSSVRVSIAEALSDPDAYARLVGPESDVTSIILDSLSLSRADSPSELIRLVSETMKANKSLSFTGDVAYWLDSGIFDQPGINGDGFSLSVPPSQRNADASDSSHDPCASRFQVVVSDSGGLFPCHGLVGTTFGQIGHITDSAVEVLSAADWGELADWAKRGPAINGPHTPPPGALPAICRRHREDLRLRGTSLSGN